MEVQERKVGAVFSQGALISDFSACKANLSAAKAFRPCSPVQKVGNVAY